MLIPMDGQSRPAGASGRTTSTRACSRTTSSSSGAPVDDDVASLMIAQMLFLEAGEPREGHRALHQLARRLGQRGAGHLRHHAVHQARRGDPVRRAGGLDGGGPAAPPAAKGKRTVAAQQPGADPSALAVGPAGPAERHRDPRAGTCS